MYFEAFIVPSVATRAPELFESFPAGGGWEGFLAGVLASGALFGVGFLLLAITMFRAGMMPRMAIVLAVLGGVPFAVNFLLPRPVAILAVIAFTVGLLWLAYALWKSHRLVAGADG
jgi:H+/gluconate symporter-like permease